MSLKQTAWIALAYLCSRGGNGWAQAPAPTSGQPAGTFRRRPGPSANGWSKKPWRGIKIADCGGSFWGVVSWEAKPGVDSKNPDETCAPARTRNADSSWHGASERKPVGRKDL